MGSCVSTQDYSSESPVKHQLASSSIREEAHSVVLLRSTTTRSSPLVVTDILKPDQPSTPSPSSYLSPRMGCDDEIFFDSQQYLQDSDSEDNQSFNGDFANSGHDNGFAETVGVDEDKNQISPVCEDFRSPTEKRKKLEELFGTDGDDQGFTDGDGKKVPASLRKGKRNSLTVNNKSERLKAGRSFSSCMPNLPSSMSLSARRRVKPPTPSKAQQNPHF